MISDKPPTRRLPEFQHPGTNWRLTLRLALTNVRRQHRRTLLSILPVALGLLALLTLWSLDGALRENLTGNFQDGLVGSIQIHQRGFFRSPSLEHHITDAERISALIEDLDIQRWTTRMENFTLAIGPGGTTGLMLIALDPEREPISTRLHEKIDKGEFLSADDPYSCLLGEGAARNLGVSVGDQIDLISNDRFGAPVGDTFTVRGILKGGGYGVEKGIVFVPLASAQELFEMMGKVTTILLRVPDSKRDSTRDWLAAQLDPNQFEVLRWNDMFPVMEEWIHVQKTFEHFFVAVVLILIIAAIGNVALVSALARRKEFGTMLALGEPTAGLSRLLLMETALHGLIGIVTGLVSAFLLISLLGIVGIDLGALVGGNTDAYFVDPVLYPRFDWEVALFMSIAVFIASVLSGLLPAWRAARLDPLEAMARG